MDESKIMMLVSPEQLAPVVRIANDHPLDDGRAFVERQIPDVQCVYVAAGRAEYTVLGTCYQAPAGSVIVITPTQPHTLRIFATEESPWLCTVHGECVADGQWVRDDYRLQPGLPTVCPPWPDAQRRQRFKQLAAIYNGYGAWRTQRMSALYKDILLELLEHSSGADDHVTAAPDTRILQAIRAHMDQPLNRNDIAAILDITPAHANYLARKLYGVPLQFVIHREKCLIAQQLLVSGSHNVQQAATAVGFSDPFHFSRVFKKIMGQAPRQVRAGMA